MPDSKWREKKGWRWIAIGTVSVVVVIAIVGAIVGIVKGRDGGEAVKVEKTSGKPPIEEGPSATLQDERMHVAAPPESGEEVESGQVETDADTPSADLPSLDKIIKTALMAIEVKEGEFSKRYDEVSLIAQKVGGWVSSSSAETSGDDGKISVGTITIRVPSDAYPGVMDQVKKLGEVLSISEETQDVSEEYTDIESRLRNLRAQESVYLNLMAKAKTIEESIAVQRELSYLQEQIEQLTGRKNYLDNMTGYATIQVTIQEPGTGGVSDDGEGWGVGKAFSDAAHGIVDAFNGIVRFFGHALIYLVIIFVIVALAYLIIKKRSSGGKGGPDETTLPPPPAGQ